MGPENDQNGFDNVPLDGTNIQNEPPPLAELTQHYLVENHLPTKKEHRIINVTLVFVSSTGAYNYVPLTLSYLERDDAVTLSKNPYIVMLSILVFSVGVLVNATDIFIQFHRNEQIPRSLKHLLGEPNSKGWRRFKNGCIATGSLLSASPLATAFLGYVKNWPVWASILALIIIIFDNTVLHFLPFKLMMMNRLYRAPILPFEIAALSIHYHRLSPVQKIARQKNLDIADLKAQLTEKIAAAVEKHIQQSFTYLPRSMSYKITPPQIAKEIAQGTLSKENWLDILKSLTTVTNTSQNSELIPLVNSQNNKETPNCFAVINDKLYPLIFFIGAALVVLACLGYIISPFKLMRNLVKDTLEASLISAVPIYAFSVLLVFFGGNMLTGWTHYLTHWGKNDNKLSMEFKLAPKTLTILNMFNVFYGAPFSYQAAAGILYSNLTEEQFQSYLPKLLIVCMVGLAFFGLNAIHDLFKFLIREITRAYGSNEAKTLLTFRGKAEQYKSGLTLMKTDIFKEVISNLEEDDLKAILDDTKEQLNKKLDHQNNHEAAHNALYSTRIANFFRSAIKPISECCESTYTTKNSARR